MATKTIFVDSRTRMRGSHADFSVSLPEGITLRGARLFVDAIRTTDTLWKIPYSISHLAHIASVIRYFLVPRKNPCDKYSLWQSFTFKRYFRGNMHSDAYRSLSWYERHADSWKRGCACSRFSP